MDLIGLYTPNKMNQWNTKITPKEIQVKANIQPLTSLGKGSICFMTMEELKIKKHTSYVYLTVCIKIRYDLKI